MLTTSLGINAAPASAVNPAQLGSGLVAYYPLDDDTGSVAHDASGNNQDGVAHGGYEWQGTDGIALDGVDCYVDLPDNLLTGLDSVTFSFDVKISPDQSGAYILYGLGNTTDRNGDGYIAAAADCLRTAVAPNRSGPVTDYSADMQRGVGSRCLEEPRLYPNSRYRCHVRGRRRIRPQDRNCDHARLD